jgi:hypothetical protein
MSVGSLTVDIASETPREQVLELDSSTCSSLNYYLLHKSVNNLTVAGQEKRTVNSDDRHIHVKFPTSTLLNSRPGNVR